MYLIMTNIFNEQTWYSPLSKSGLKGEWSTCQEYRPS